MSLISLAALIRFVRERSPYYRELYRDLPKEIETLDKLPLVEPCRFWEANSYVNNQLLTGPIQDGLILRSGGTTGKPKFSVFSRDEWNVFTQTFAQKLAHSGLVAGDRVANLFYVGELYGSFIFTHKVLEECPVKTLQLPIAGTAPLPEAIALIKEYEATVLAGLPTTLMTLVEKMGEESFGKTKVRLLLFAGEPLQKDQRARLLQAFPGAEIRSIGYASNDAGALGYTDPSCAPNEFRCYDGYAIYEIFDEATGQVITEPGREGIAVITNLKRSLMPVIRYPVGDRAMWVEPQGTPDRKYLLLGRSEETARIASLSVGFDEIQSLLGKYLAELGSFQFQLVMVHYEGHDGLVIRIASSKATDSMSQAMCEKQILSHLHELKPILRRFVEDRKIHPTQIEWREPGGLETNSRTGKLRRVIDQRA